VRVAPVLVAMTIALLVHIPLAIWFVQNTWLRESSPHERTPIQVTLNVQPPEAEEEEPEAEDEADDEGQIVEIAPPEEPERPEEADFLRDQGPVHSFLDAVSRLAQVCPDGPVLSRIGNCEVDLRLVFRPQCAALQ